MEKFKITEMTCISGIYLIQYPNNKVYIGQAQNIRARILEHNCRARNNKRGDGRQLQLCDQKIQQYFPWGVQEYFILERCDKEMLDDREKHWIAFYDALNKQKGYNFLDKGNVSGRRGVEHTNASLDQAKLDMLVDFLINRQDLSYKDISEQLDISLSVVQNVCWGNRYVNDNLEYPLRKNNHSFARKDSILDYFDSEETLLNLKEDLKLSWWLSIEVDLIKKYNIPLNILRDINQGRKFQNIGNYSYPIRTNSVRNKNSLTKNDIIAILNKLRTTQLSMTQIGKIYNLHRDTISKINLGRTFPILNYDYPARNTK